MVPMRELCPGMRVKIVDQWGPGCGQNSRGRMDKYLGQIVTIYDVFSNGAYIEEDAGDRPVGHWCWNENCFDYIVEDEEQTDFEVMSNSEILSLICGN